jgi:PBSX family phage terminase large subunit
MTGSKSPWKEPGPKAWDFILDSTARINIAEGSVRSGKTVGSLIRWAEYVDSAPPGELLIAAKTERTLRRNIIRPLQDYLGTRAIRINWGSGEGKMLGRTIYVAGANDERAEGKIRGMTLAGAYGDEITLWPEGFFAMLLSRLSVTGAKFFGTTNPDGPFHWLLTKYLDRSDLVDAGDLKRWRFTLDDNPHLDPAFVASLKREYTGLWFKRFILGLWVMAEGAVYDMFDTARHVTTTIYPALTRRIVCIDYGTTNPCVFHLVAAHHDKRQARAHVLREYRWDSVKQGRQKTDAQYAADLKEWLGKEKPEAIYVDPSAASFIAELRKAGWTVTKANNEVLEGIRFVSTWLADGRLTFDPSCKGTIAEFQSYVWDALAAKRGEDAPKKAYDHGPDAVRYGIFTHFKQAHAPAVVGVRTF